LIRKLEPSCSIIFHPDPSKLLAGTEAGVILVLLFNPLWLTKTRLALQGATNNPRPYKGFIGKLPLSEKYSPILTDLLCTLGVRIILVLRYREAVAIQR
jgi:Mitochondrial carrier protein